MNGLPISDWLKTPFFDKWLAQQQASPFLIVDYSDDSHTKDKSQTEQFYTPSTVSSDTDVAHEEALFGEITPRSQVFRVAKSPDQPYQDKILLGRTPGNDIIINCPTVSRAQVSFSDQGGEWVIEDLGSTNGTKVNGESLRNQDRATLFDGAELKFGPNVYARFFSENAFLLLIKRFRND